MKLIFEGHSTIERGFEGVKFVGCCREPQDRDRYVPCRVTGKLSNCCSCMRSMVLRRLC